MGTRYIFVQKKEKYLRAMSMSYETIKYRISKGPQGFGIALGGGASKRNDFGDTGIFITDVLPGPAMGNLVVGDIILKLNGIDMSKAEKPQATSLLKGSKDAEFLIRRRIPQQYQVEQPGYQPSGYGVGPAQSSTMMMGSQQQASQMMDPAMMMQQMQQQQMMNQQQMQMPMPNSMYEHEDPNMAMANVLKNSVLPEKQYSESDEDYHSRQRKSDYSRGSTPEKQSKKKKNKKYTTSESSSRGSSLERDLKKIKIRDDYVTIPVKAHEPKTITLKKNAGQSFGMKLGTRVFVQGLTNNGLAMSEGLNNEDLILAINGQDVDSLTIPEVQQMLINVDQVELEVQQVTGGTVTLPADVLNGLGSAKTEKRKKQKKKTRRSTSEDYHHRRRSDDRYSPRHDDRRGHKEERTNDPYVSQRSTHV